jgi:Domain of unknown function (DUF4402)
MARTLSICVAAVALGLAASPVLATERGDNDRDRCRAVEIDSTRDLAFGRVTASSNGWIEISATSTPSTGGGVQRVGGGMVSSARFVVEGKRETENERVIITLPQEFFINVEGRRFRVDAIRAALDDVGLNWTEIGAGRYQCTLSTSRRCAFVVGGRLNLTRTEVSGAGLGQLRARAVAWGSRRHCDRDRNHDHDDDDD